jgi:hypothetical protein
VAEVVACPASTTRRGFAGPLPTTDGLSGKILAMSWDELAKAVRDRRRALNLTQVEVTERGGPSVGTQQGIETGRASRLSKRLRRALERAIEWEPGSIDRILAGGRPQPLAGSDAAVAVPVAQDAVATEERFAVAQRVLEMKRTLAEHQNVMPESAREALEAEITQAAREVEAAIIKMLPWLSDQERGHAIRILAQLRADE